MAAAEPAGRRAEAAGAAGAAEAGEGLHRGAAGAARGAGKHLIGDGPLHARADEDRRELHASCPAAGAAAAAGVDLVAVVLVVGDPVDAIEHAVVAAQGVVI